MPYLILRESYLSTSCTVDGLPLNEVRTVTEKTSCPSDLRDEKNRRVEFRFRLTIRLPARLVTETGKAENGKYLHFPATRAGRIVWLASTPAYNLLNALEKIGYRVITSSSFVSGTQKFATKDFVWTLYRSSYEADMG